MLKEVKTSMDVPENTETNIPLISVIMGTYNPDSKIETAIASIISQTSREWEFLICDDGSEKERAIYLHKLCLMDDRITLLQNSKNEGLAFSLNKCINASRGKYIARMDDDDISLPERFLEQKRFLDENPEYGFVGTQAVLYDDFGEWGIGDRPAAPSQKDYLPYSPFIHSSVMFRADVLKNAKGYTTGEKTKFCEDYELFMRLYAGGARGYNLQRILMKYYENRNTLHFRSFSQFIHEAQIRAEGFARLRINPFLALPYVMKPVVVAPFSASPRLYHFLKRIRKKGNYMQNIKANKYADILEKDPFMLNAICEERQEKCHQPKQSILVLTAKYVMAPVLNYFTQWLLGKALKLGIKRIYFLSRDGYLMFRNACEYCRIFRLDIECRYLYCSRYSLRVPLYHKNMDQALDHIFRNGIDISLGRIFRRTGLDDQEIDDLTFKLQIDKALLGKILTYQELMAWKDKLSHNQIFINSIREHSNLCWDNMAGYFIQEGLLDPIPMAIADSGWTGTTQDSVQKIMEYLGDPIKLQGFYFGLFEIPPLADNSRYHSFYFSPKDKFLRKAKFANCLFEALYSAPYGMTTGYCKERSRYKPTLLKGDASAADRINMEEIIISDVTGRYLELRLNAGKTLCNEIKENIEIVQKLLETLMWTPSREEAKVLGNIMFSDDLLDMNMQMIAPDFDDKELFKNHFISLVCNRLGIYRGTIHESAWLSGTATKNGRYIVWHKNSNGAYKVLMYIRKAVIK